MLENLTFTLVNDLEVKVTSDATKSINSHTRISRSKAPFKHVRFEGKHEGERSNINIQEQSL